MQTPELVEAFLTALQGRRAANTIAAYRSDLWRFALACPGPAAAITTTDLIDYLSTAGGGSPSTLARRQASLRTLFAWAFRMEHLPADPAARLEGVAVPERLPRPLSAAEIEQVLRAIPAAKLRDRLFFTLLRDTGIRVGEALSVRWEDVDLREGDEQLRVLGKGGRERTVLLHAAPDTLRMLHRYRRVGTTSGYVFHGDPRRRGSTAAPMDYKSVHYAWRRYCTRAGVHATIHQLRHSFVTELVRGGMRLTTVQRLAGHRRLETTRTYAAVSDAEVKRELSDFRRRQAHQQ